MTTRHPFTHERLDCYRLAVEVNRWFDGASFPRGRSHLRDQGLRAIDSVVVTDTIPLGDLAPEGVQVLSSADLLGDAILRIHQGRSVSKLFPV